MFNDVFLTVRRIIHVRTLLNAFLQFYTQISVIIPYVVVAPFYFVENRSTSDLQPVRRRVQQRQQRDELLRQQYIGLADFSATIQRLTSFEEAFARARADEQRKPRI